MHERVCWKGYDTMHGLERYADDDFCYLTTTGRVSGRPHTIEIWFALEGRTLYLLAGDHGSDWVKNLRKTPAVELRLRDTTYPATARLVSDGEEDAHARRLVVAKYQPRDSDDLSEWGRDALAVAVDIDGRPAPA
jgi:deazaflavin-dependent oxidoreductase (nitroreductase family)